MLTTDTYLAGLCFAIYGGIALGMIGNWKEVYFNPIKNYNKWTQFNWFGITIITLIINIVFLPYAICYWIYKLFTIGRREKK